MYESTISSIYALFAMTDSALLLQIFMLKVHFLAKKRTEAFGVFIFYFWGGLSRGWKFGAHTRFYEYEITSPVSQNEKFCWAASRELPFQFKRTIACELSDNISIII